VVGRKETGGKEIANVFTVLLLLQHSRFKYRVHVVKVRDAHLDMAKIGDSGGSSKIV
jgi:hypothetical protein